MTSEDVAGLMDGFLNGVIWLGKWGLSFMAALLLPVDPAFKALFVFMALDFFSGMVSAAINGELSSHSCMTGLARKTMIVILVCAAKVAVSMAGWEPRFGSMVATAYCINELISITENCYTAGINVPRPVIDYLAKAKDLLGWQGRERRRARSPYEPYYTGPERRTRTLKPWKDEKCP